MTGSLLTHNMAIKGQVSQCEKEAVMRGIKLFGLSLMLMSVTACAPVVYDATYRAPTGHVYVQTTYTQPSYRHATTYQQIHPIEVTLYANNNTGAYFRPIQLVISSGQYVEIPVKSRRGRTGKIFAHYHNGDLHFDSDRNCRVIQGSTRYSYDKRWDNGYRYTKINAGKDYDLSGLHLQIRNVQAGKRQAKKIVPAKIVNKQVVVHANNGKRAVRQQVSNDTSRSNGKRAVLRETTHPVNSRSAKFADRYVNNQPGRSVKVPISKEKTSDRVNMKALKTVKRPVIVQKINKHEQSRRITSVNTKSVGKKPVHGSAKKNVKIFETQNNGKSHKIASAEGTVNVAKSNNRRVSVKSERSDMAEQTEEPGKPAKVRGRE